MIQYDLLDKVNYDVNRYITYTPDGASDKWNLATITEESRKGDCEDYAIVKANRLIKLHGCDSKYMRIGKFRTSKGTYHAMLIVDGEHKKGFFRKITAPCQWVLDNRWDAIYRMDQIRDKLIIQYQVDKWI
jgi:predicted transglutaminase-like cysteine proteinase